MRINRVVKILVTSDFLFVSGYGVFGPVFAVFITEQVVGGSLAVVGFAAAIVQISKSIFQIPIARYLDKNHGELDDFYSLLLGSFLVALSIFLYITVKTPFHLYLVQALYGIGAAFAIPPWYAIFTRHIDKLHMNLEWSLDSVAIGIGGALAASLGGILADNFGFSFVFILGGLVFTLGSFMQILIFKNLKREVMQGQVLPKK